MALAVAPLTGFLYRNRDEVLFGDLLPYILVIGGSVLVLSVGLSILFDKNGAQALSLVVGCSVLILFSYRDVESLSETVATVVRLPGGGPGLWVAMTLAALSIVWYFHARTWLLNIAFWFSLTVAILPVGLYILYSTSVSQDPVEVVLAPPTVVLDDRPDVYFLMLDGMGRQDVLKEFYELDIAPLVNHLETNGFIVADRALGSHPITLLEFPAILDNQYQVQPGDPGPPETYEDQLRIMAGANYTQEVFRTNGYHFISAGSGSLLCRPSPIDSVETCVNEWISDNLHALGVREQLINMTPLPGIIHRGLLPDPVVSELLRIDDWWSEETAGGKGFMIQDVLAAVEEFRSRKGSQSIFVAAHMMHTHPPFTLNEDCSFRDSGFSGTQGDWDDPVGYRRSIACIERQIVELVGSIDQSDIVVIQSDHGPVVGQPDSLDSGSGDFGVPAAPLQTVWARAAVFSAVRLPPRCRDSVSDTYAGVVTFSVVLNCLTGLDSRREAERVYWTWYWDQSVLDLTERLRSFEASLG